MESQTLFDLNYDVWSLIANLHYKMVLLRKKELRKQHITPRQMHILRLIDNLGPKARLSTIAEVMERKIDAISRKAAIMENGGLIKRIKDTPRSRLFKLELSEKGRNLLKTSKYSNGMNEVSSILNEEELQQLYSVLNRLSIKLNEYAS